MDVAGEGVLSYLVDCLLIKYWRGGQGSSVIVGEGVALLLYYEVLVVAVRTRE